MGMGYLGSVAKRNCLFRTLITRDNIAPLEIDFRLQVALMRERNLNMEVAGPPPGGIRDDAEETCNCARSSLRCRLPAVCPPGLEGRLQSNQRSIFFSPQIGNLFRELL